MSNKKSTYVARGHRMSRHTVSRHLVSRHGKHAVSYKQEIIGAVLFFLFSFLSLAFFSYSATDNSWFYFSSANASVSNWCGVIGANIASFFFFFLGSASYVLLVGLMCAVFLLFRMKSLKSFGLRISFLPIFVIASASLFRMHGIDFISPNPGGVLGQLCSQFFLYICGTSGAFLLLYTLLWVSMLVLSRVSFLSFATCIGSIVMFTSVRLFKGTMCTLGYVWAGVSWLGMHAVRLFRKKKEDVVARFEVPDGAGCEWDDLAGLARGSRTPVSKTRESKRRASRCPGPKSHGPKSHGPKGSQPESHGLESRGLESQGTQERDAVSYTLPDFSAFEEPLREKRDMVAFERECRERGKKLEEKLLHFGIKGKVVAIRPGPVITLFEYKPEIDSKISKIVSLEDDLAMALTALSIRIIAPIPGKNVIGFEISNQKREAVGLARIVKKQHDGYLSLALGVDIIGGPVFQDLVKMPHILVAGSTGSGKSVGLNAMLVSLLCHRTPDELKVVLIDPKRLEFVPYADIPHLLFPIVTNPRKAVPVLKWIVQEMEDRYELMSKVGVRNIIDYHNMCKKVHTSDTGEQLPKMPFIVLMIDELADLMIVAGKDVETQIARIAQMARAAGIHMIVATQRPSVDVVTGVIKVNFPARIAFRVSSKIDSRTIIDTSGAEKLLGRGDMLFLNSGSSTPQRVHGAYVSSAEITKLADYLRAQQAVSYLDINEALRRKNTAGVDDFDDQLYDEVKEFVKSVDEISISLLQRKYRIGFNRSARLIEKLELDGIIAPPSGGKMRKVIR